MTFQGAKVRMPLLAVSGVIDKGNIVVFDGSGSFILPNSCAGVASVRKAITGVQGRTPLHAKNGVFVLRTWVVVFVFSVLCLVFFVTAVHTLDVVTSS